MKKKVNYVNNYNNLLIILIKIELKYFYNHLNIITQILFIILNVQCEILNSIIIYYNTSLIFFFIVVLIFIR